MENNKLIAEFMGVRFMPDDEYIERLKENREEGVCFDLGRMESELKYHESWDWLMPVIREVQTRYEVDEGIEIDYDELQHAVMDNDIERVYEQVVEFIKEHNKYICGSCGDHVNEVVFNEDTDIDECKNCTI